MPFLRVCCFLGHFDEILTKIENEKVHQGSFPQDLWISGVVSCD